MMKKSNKQSTRQTMPRREFLKGASLSAAAFSIVPRHVLGGKGDQAPSDTATVAAVGAGSMGASSMSRFATENVVALAECDYDRVRAAVDREGREELKAAYDTAKWYQDFPEMLEKQNDIDAVVVAPPDHVQA